MNTVVQLSNPKLSTVVRIPNPKSNSVVHLSNLLYFSKRGFVYMGAGDTFLRIQNLLLMGNAYSIIITDF